MKSLGVIETRGLTSAIQAADAACKAASVEIVGYRKIGSGLVSVCFQGEISAVRTAVDHGIEVIASSQLLVGSLVIARPEESVISKLLTVKSKKGELEKSVEAKTEAPVAEVKTDINVKDIKNDPRKGKKS
ncbi:BMC domain-containing protein [Providencia rettgeri]|uniref:BMC domain-containing protein n=1 Tax=Providencia rettgeri TaxID=587 RepID=A0AAD2VQF4_PRORE|nr:BMC domain-containing protein [Providencia rettgeri]